MVGHEATQLSYNQGIGVAGLDHRTIIEISPPGITKTVWYSDADALSAEVKPDARVPVLSKDAAGKMLIHPTERVLRYKDRDGLKEKTRVWPGSLLDDLRLLGTDWARILGWEEEEMTMWLLAGEPPSRQPLVPKVCYGRGGPTVTLAYAKAHLTCAVGQQGTKPQLVFVICLRAPGRTLPSRLCPRP